MSEKLGLSFHILHTLGFDWQKIDVQFGWWARPSDLIDEAIAAFRLSSPLCKSCAELELFHSPSSLLTF